MTPILMKYKVYKQKYPEFKTVANTYDTKMKTIEVLLPDDTANRIEAKTGKRLKHLVVTFIRQDGSEFERWINYFTYDGMDSQIAEIEKEWNCKQKSSRKVQ